MTVHTRTQGFRRGIDQGEAVTGTFSANLRGHSKFLPCELQFIAIGAYFLPTHFDVACPPSEGAVLAALAASSCKIMIKESAMEAETANSGPSKSQSL